MDPIQSPGEELYAQSRLVAPTFYVYLKPWSELTRDERDEWEVMADEMVKKDA